MTFLLVQPITAIADGCTSVDFGVPRSFEAVVNTSFNYPDYVAADLNGDGKPDLAVTDAITSNVQVFLNDGFGNLGVPAVYGVEAAPRAIKTADFNGDGRPDLVVTNSQSNTVSVLQGTGGVTFQPGEVAKTVPVTILPDTFDESPEFFHLFLWGAVNARLSDGVAKVTLTDDDVPPTVSINDVTVTESDSSFVTATFTVTLSSPSSHTISVAVATANGTAQAGSDYALNQSGIMFGAGETTKTFLVDVTGDRTFEPDETFFVNLSNPVDATITDGQGQGTILNNDSIPSITVFDATATEATGSDTNFNLVVRLSNASSQTVSVDFSTADGSALAGADYTASSGTVTFNPGEAEKNIPLTVKVDEIDETSETFLVNLSNPVNATITDGQATVNISDNDGPSASINDVTVTEGQSGITVATFTVTLSAASPQAVTVRAVTASGTATGGFDYANVTNRIIDPRRLNLRDDERKCERRSGN